MNWISIGILVLIIVAAIFVLSYVAHDRGSSMCAGCHGDCEKCGMKKEDSQKKKES